MGTTMSLHLKERMKTNWLLIPRISFSPILKAWCTITDSSATSPVARLIGFSLAVNESCKYCRILKQSERSLIIRVCAISLCWSLVLALCSSKILHSSIYLYCNRHRKKPRCPLPFTHSTTSSNASRCFQIVHKDLLHHRIWRKAGPKTIASTCNMLLIHEMIMYARMSHVNLRYYLKLKVHWFLIMVATLRCKVWWHHLAHIKVEQLISSSLSFLELQANLNHLHVLCPKFISFKRSSIREY